VIIIIIIIIFIFFWLFGPFVFWGFILPIRRMLKFIIQDLEPPRYRTTRGCFSEVELGFV
jgi:hypothetical protein